MVQVKSPIAGSGTTTVPAVLVIAPCTMFPAGFGHVSTTTTLFAFEPPVFVTVMTYSYVFPSPAFAPWSSGIFVIANTG